VTTLPVNAFSKQKTPSIVWWSIFLVASIWCQELTGGLDFLSPGLLICLQMSQWGTVLWMTTLWVFIQEGIGNFEFGVIILFYTGMYLAFFLSRWLLEPGNFLFIFLFSLILAIWNWIIVLGAVSFQELHVLLPSPWKQIPLQWLAYVVHWSISLALFRRSVKYGHL
jgi:hypothetical protein